MSTSLPDRFAFYCVPFGDCLYWQGAKQSRGYGVVRIGTTVHLAHRTAYRLFVGAIPTGMELDHLCGHRWCVNPRHLEAVSHAENLRRIGRR